MAKLGTLHGFSTPPLSQGVLHDYMALDMIETKAGTEQNIWQALCCLK
jgi:hypothetical protein